MARIECPVCHYKKNRKPRGEYRYIRCKSCNAKIKMPKEEQRARHPADVGISPMWLILVVALLIALIAYWFATT